jgi:hypothetical protein
VLENSCWGFVLEFVTGSLIDGLMDFGFSEVRGVRGLRLPLGVFLGFCLGVLVLLILVLSLILRSYQTFNFGGCFLIQFSSSLDDAQNLNAG